MATLGYLGSKKKQLGINQLPLSANCGLYYKSFMIVIYNRNDSGLYYKTTITTKASLI